MSWSVRAVGRAKAVADKVAVELNRITCVEPEETIKRMVGAIVATALAAYPDDQVVTVELSGAQYTNAPGTATNDLKVKIEPMYGFVG